MQPHERLDAWKAAHALVLAIYASTKGWPAEERYGLTSQIRRAAFSVAANIVEGRAKHGPKEFRRYLDMSWGSLAELGYTLHLARDIGILAASEFDQLEALRAATGRPLYGLLRSMGA